MKTGFMQWDVSRDREENLRRIGEGLEQFRGGVAVLPELAVCGYLFADRRSLWEKAEPVPEGPSVQAMLELSEKHGCAVIFGLPEKENGQVYNTAAAVDRGRFAGKYRKAHLTDFEKRLFTPGNGGNVLTLMGVKVGVQICFDLWFPEIARRQLREGAELFCAPCNFGGEMTLRIAQVRAMENLTPLVLCNRVGSEALPGINADFRGESRVIGPDGGILCAGAARESGSGLCEMTVGAPRGNVLCGDFLSEIAREER